MASTSAREMEPNRAVLRVCGATDVGLLREKNQDRFVIADLGSGEISTPCAEVNLSLRDSGFLLLVCDGMGGAAAGEVAASIATASIRDRLASAGDTVSQRPKDLLGEAVEVANHDIFTEARRTRERRGMGTTCTAALVLPGSVTVAQVGDSRAYLLRAGTLWALTKDQSLTNQLLDAGILRPEQVDTFTQRHVLSQALGTHAAVEPVIGQYAILPGDRLLLCSDGLHGDVSENDILAALAEGHDLTDVTKQLVDRALAAGGQDNVTVVVGEYVGEPQRAEPTPPPA